MRYEKGHKETTRRRIVETAAARFRKDGIEGVGLADLMAEAGLTHGGFYSHFSSKEDLVKAALEEIAQQSRNTFKRRIEEGGLENWIRHYLRSEHRDHPEKGCVMATLGTELPRHPETSRACLTQRMKELIPQIESHLPSTLDASTRRKTATGLFATLVGALQMARTATDPVLSDEILEAGIATALSLAGIKPSASS